MRAARDGRPLSIDARTVTCGGRLYISDFLSRFRVMADAMQDCFLGGGHAWVNARERIAAGSWAKPFPTGAPPSNRLLRDVLCCKTLLQKKAAMLYSIEIPYKNTSRLMSSG